MHLAASSSSQTVYVMSVGGSHEACTSDSHPFSDPAEHYESLSSALARYA